MEFKYIHVGSALDHHSAQGPGGRPGGGPGGVLVAHSVGQLFPETREGIWGLGAGGGLPGLAEQTEGRGGEGNPLPTYGSSVHAMFSDLTQWGLRLSGTWWRLIGDTLVLGQRGGEGRGVGLPESPPSAPQVRRASLSLDQFHLTPSPLQTHFHPEEAALPSLLAMFTTGVRETLDLLRTMSVWWGWSSWRAGGRSTWSG